MQLRSDWERVKLMYMYEICMCKFMQNPTLCKALLATGNCHLVEGNNWGDYFWGSVNGHGENHLGRIYGHTCEVNLNVKTIIYPILHCMNCKYFAIMEDRF